MPVQVVFVDNAHRAILAFQRRCIREGAVFQQPSDVDCLHDTDAGDTFIVPRNIRGVLAVYRERGNQRSLKYVEPSALPEGLGRPMDR